MLDQQSGARGDCIYIYICGIVGRCAIGTLETFSLNDTFARLKIFEAQRMMN